ncbi:septation protein SepH [Sinomonas mesophila]|uniref:septation protein SepH n=1 Tax=Sinomonas mesophila TaxID=1531955 RepID=UPI001FE7AC47|nr:septation protein SepH [Sinomonas mesophila]
MREQPQDHVQQLRLVGVHDDGAHLLVSAASGEVFRLPLDEALRRAVSRPAPQRPPAGGADGPMMSPRQIQAEIRAGATAEEVAESSGVPLARVQRYEGPVLAEREHMVRRAQAVEVPGRLPSHDVLRGPAASQPVSLGEMVEYRLSLHRVHASSVVWDSWRRPDGQWTVVARFELPDGAPLSIGEEPPAMWTYHPMHRTVANANRWAQQLSELEPLDGPAPRRRLAAVSDRPFDVEAEVVRESPGRDGAPRQDEDREGELLDMLRARRGQRLGVDEDGDDALALLLTNGIPAAHPRPSEAHASDSGPGEDGAVHGPALPATRDAAHDLPAPRAGAREAEHSPMPRGGITSLFSRLEPRGDGTEGHLGLFPGVSTATREISITPAPAVPAEPPAAAGSTASGDQDDGGAAPPPEPTRRSSRPKRSSVPSWDEIVFGTKGD